MKKGMSLAEARSLVGRTVRVRWHTTRYERGACPDCGSDKQPEPVYTDEEHEAEGELRVGEWELNNRFIFLRIGDQHHIDSIDESNDVPQAEAPAFEFVEWEVAD